MAWQGTKPPRVAQCQAWHPTSTARTRGKAVRSDALSPTTGLQMGVSKVIRSWFCLPEMGPELFVEAQGLPAHLPGRREATRAHLPVHRLRPKRVPRSSCLALRLTGHRNAAGFKGQKLVLTAWAASGHITPITHRGSAGWLMCGGRSRAASSAWSSCLETGQHHPVSPGGTSPWFPPAPVQGSLPVGESRFSSPSAGQGCELQQPENHAGSQKGDPAAVTLSHAGSPDP